MKKNSFLIVVLICVLFSFSFATINILSPLKTDSFNGLPIYLEWEQTDPAIRKIPVIYSIYIGNSEDTLELYENNLLGTQRAIFFLPDDYSGRLYWKIVASNKNGIVDESEISSFRYKRSYYYQKPEEVKILLSWEKDRFDLDLHLTGKNVNGGEFHMFDPLSDENNGSPWPSQIRMRAYSRGNLNYKEITLSKSFISDYLASAFRVSVESANGNISGSEAKVEIYFDGELMEVYEVPVEDSDAFWNVFDFTQVNAQDLRIDIVDKLSKTSSSIWAYDKGLDGNVFVDSWLPGLPEDLDFVIEAPVKLVDVDDFIDIIDDLEIEVDLEDLEIAKINLPQGVELDTEKMSVFVNDVACKVFIRKAKTIRTSVDIMFVVDRSGSMDSEIYGVQSSLERFIDHLNGIGFNARVGILAYGSYAPSSAGWQDLGDFSDTLTFISNRLMNSAGGTEVPYTAIYYVFENADWDKDAEKHIILVTDEDSEENGRYENISKSNLIRKLGTEYAVHTILSDQDDYSRYTTNYSPEWDPREIAEKTNGVIEYTDGSGVVNLANSGILNFAENAYYVFIDVPEGVSGEVKVLYETNQGTGFSSSK